MATLIDQHFRVPASGIVVIFKHMICSRLPLFLVVSISVSLFCVRLCAERERQVHQATRVFVILICPFSFTLDELFLII